MKKALTALLFAMPILIASCKKVTSQDELGTVSATDSNKSSGLSRIAGVAGSLCDVLPFAVLALNNGSLSINSSSNITGTIGYSAGVTSPTNQKVDLFTGKALVHSGVTSFIYTAVTFLPTEGILRNSAPVDEILNSANTNALSISSTYSNMAPNLSFGNVTTNLSVNSVAFNTVIEMSSMDYNSKVLTLNGTAGADNGFIINVAGSFDFSQSQIVLNNVRSERVIFNFPNASNITLNKSANIFRGTILAPLGNIIYHNPASFEGSIIGLNISLHSDFNLIQRTYCGG